MEKKITADKINMILLILLMHFNNDTLANNLCTFVKQPVQYIAIAIIVIVGLQILTKREMLTCFNKRLFIGVVLLLVFVMTTAAIDVGESNGYFLLFISLIPAVLITVILDFSCFVAVFCKYVTILAGGSIVCTYLIKNISALCALFERVTNSSGIVFYNMHICYVHVGANYYRNFGIYREPGVFGIVLCISLFLMISHKSSLLMNHFAGKYYKMFIIIQIVALITTFSTTSYLAFFIFIIVYGVVKRNMNVGHVVLIGFICGLLMWFSSSYIENPLVKLSANSSSLQFRVESIITGVKLLINRPFGYGINRGLAEYKANYSMSAFHNTNTWMAIGVYLGLPFLMVILYGMTSFCKRYLDGVVLIIPILLLLSGELLIYNPLLYLMVLFGLMNNAMGEHIDDYISY